jgi:Na+/citrate or Na+/malate symporter
MLWQDHQHDADEHVELPMFTSGAPRGALWLAGGILATILGAVVNQVFHDRIIAVIVGVVFAVAFGAATEQVGKALNRRTGPPTSPPMPKVPADDIHASDQTG